MAENNNDPAGSTQMFRAFVDEGANDPRANASSSRMGLVVATVVVVLAVVAAAVWFFAMK